MKLLYLIFLALIKITGAMPLQVSSFLLTRLGRIAYYLDIKHRNIAIENLKVAFGNEKSQEEIELIARKVFENLPLTFLDFCRIPKITKDNLSKFVTFENIEYVHEEIKKEKGLLLVTAHFGSWEILPHLFSLNYKPLNIIVRPLDNTALDMAVSKYRTFSGNKLIEKKNGLKHILKALQRKEIIGTLNDQNVKYSEGVFVDFFGKKACTNFVLGLISLRTDVPVIMGFIIREGLNKHRIRFEKLIDIEKGIDRGKYILDFTQAITTVTENYIRKFPEQWFWVHRRWKTKPKALSKGSKDERGSGGN
ncbi:MAG: hypothetical protein A2W05_10215 [Candidatus Schekmanbacteria bacterium RBG_16_38_10]|uniref:Lipid A biosynthesis acyltransferase n=1 Tax=Candidatus Schekmanbacteria bacterium RBG_16_38_10 TaxID=1817879 RepID=A0A1F7RM36_9BACT|nr:MAG: hypothetical protein A2W05_10215 [Candidatus Schekmanbacteria bacterium RBG_16_38_10]